MTALGSFRFQYELRLIQKIFYTLAISAGEHLSSSFGYRLDDFICTHWHCPLRSRQIVDDRILPLSLHPRSCLDILNIPQIVVLLMYWQAMPASYTHLRRRRTIYDFSCRGHRQGPKENGFLIGQSATGIRYLFNIFQKNLGIFTYPVVQLLESRTSIRDSISISYICHSHPLRKPRNLPDPVRYYKSC